MSRNTLSEKRCAVEDCYNSAHWQNWGKRGWCAKHYLRWKRHGDVHIVKTRKLLSLERPKEVRDFLISKRRVVNDTGCWLWDGKGDRYGIICIQKCNYAVHRLMAHIDLGMPLDKGLCALHQCDVPRCFNPNHLFIGTQRDNVHDMFAKKRDNHAKGERVNTAKLCAEGVKEIRIRHANGQSANSLSKEFGVSSVAVDCIVHRRTWKHI